MINNQNNNIPLMNMICPQNIQPFNMINKPNMNMMNNPNMNMMNNNNMNIINNKNMNIMNNHNMNMMNIPNMNMMNFQIQNQFSNSFNNPNNLGIFNQFQNFPAGMLNNNQCINNMMNFPNMMPNNMNMMNNLNMMHNNMNMMNNINMIQNNMNMMNNLNMIQNNNLKIGNNNANQINNAHKITNANNMIKNENMSKNNHNGVKKEENLKKKESNKKLEDKTLKEKSLNIKNIINKIEKNMTFEYKSNQDNDKLQFISIKDELTNMVNGVIFNYLNGKKYEADKAQTWCNNISEEIIKALHQQQRGFKFVCATTIFQKGKSSLHFSSTCLWHSEKDGSITVKFENEHMHCFVSLFGITK